ncbi:MAG: hypothetical protein LUC91_03035, partial [Prevotella sp.]|nr:hypothetical protein [Prevotella sp.]
EDEDEEDDDEEDDDDYEDDIEDKAENEDEEYDEYSGLIYYCSETGKRYIIAQVDENAVKHGKLPILDYLISGVAAGEFRVKVYLMTPKKEHKSRYDWDLLYNEEFCCK